MKLAPLAPLFAAVCAIAVIASAGPGIAHANRVRVRTTRDTKATVTRWRAISERAKTKSTRCQECARFGLSVARALDKQHDLGVKGRGVFAGKSAAGEHKVVHLELVDEQRGAFTLKTQHIDGETDGNAMVRRFVEQTSGRGDYRSEDGSASFRLIRGRGVFEYRDADFIDDPE